jgi:antibiotic biosynthesis monooxygenase (ABM) superfamily enzyme
LRRARRSLPTIVTANDRPNLAWLDETSGREDLREHAARNITGYRGAELFIREEGDEIEFVTLLRFDSMDAVKEFAGSDETKPVISLGVEKLLTRMEQARHYRIGI